ncbi:MAG: GFA family protein [Pseudomonadota bacterium]
MDCRRWTGAPVAAFAAFPAGSVTLTPDPGPFSTVAGVERWFCRSCGSPLAARFDYLPDQIYVPIGVIDQADTILPAMHSHHGARLSWLHIDDDLPRPDASARDALNSAS